MELNPKVQQRVENYMLRKAMGHSQTYLFLVDLAYRANRLWPPKERRIPFFEKHFLERKMKPEIDKMKNNTSKAKLNESKASRCRKHPNFNFSFQKSNGFSTHRVGLNSRMTLEGRRKSDESSRVVGLR